MQTKLTQIKARPQGERICVAVEYRPLLAIYNAILKISTVFFYINDYFQVEIKVLSVALDINMMRLMTLPDILPLLTFCYWQFDSYICDALEEI